MAPFGAATPEIQLGYPLVFVLIRKLLVVSGHAPGIAAVPLDQLYLHPVAIAAWVGMFATSLNLLPAGSSTATTLFSRCRREPTATFRPLQFC